MEASLYPMSDGKINRSEISAHRLDFKKLYFSDECPYSICIEFEQKGELNMHLTKEEAVFLAKSILNIVDF